MRPNTLHSVVALVALGSALTACAHGESDPVFGPGSTVVGGAGGSSTTPTPSAGGSGGSTTPNPGSGGYSGGDTGGSPSSGGYPGSGGYPSSGGYPGSGGYPSSGGYAGSTGGYAGGSTGGFGGSSTPSGWTCDPAYYGEGVVGACDCGCSVADADCSGGCTAPGCTDSACDYCHDSTGGDIACGGGTGGTGGGTSSWLCDPTYYGEGLASSCDCGCGIEDPDCGGAGCTDPSCSASACNYCWDATGTEISCTGGGSTSCDDTCAYAADGECDDGGPGSSYSVCALGTDCTDCGPR